MNENLPFGIDTQGLAEKFQSLFQQQEKAQLPNTKRADILAALTAGVVAVCAAAPALGAEQGSQEMKNSIQISQRNEKDSPRVYVDVGEREGYYVDASAEALRKIKIQNERQNINKFDLHFTTHGFENVRTIDQSKDLVDPARYGLSDLKFFHPATNEANLKLGEHDGKIVFELLIQDDDGSKTTALVDLEGNLISIQ